MVLPSRNDSSVSDLVRPWSSDSGYNNSHRHSEIRSSTAAERLPVIGSRSQQRNPPTGRRTAPNVVETPSLPPRFKAAVARAEVGLGVIATDEKPEAAEAKRVEKKPKRPYVPKRDTSPQRKLAQESSRIAGGRTDVDRAIRDLNETRKEILGVISQFRHTTGSPDRVLGPHGARSSSPTVFEQLLAKDHKLRSLDEQLQKRRHRKRPWSATDKRPSMYGKVPGKLSPIRPRSAGRSQRSSSAPRENVEKLPLETEVPEDMQMFESVPVVAPEEQSLMNDSILPAAGDIDAKETPKFKKRVFPPAYRSATMRTDILNLEKWVETQLDMLYSDDKQFTEEQRKRVYELAVTEISRMVDVESHDLSRVLRNVVGYFVEQASKKQKVVQLSPEQADAAKDDGEAEDGEESYVPIKMYEQLMESLRAAQEENSKVNDMREKLACDLRSMQHAYEEKFRDTSVNFREVSRMKRELRDLRQERHELVSSNAKYRDYIVDLYRLSDAIRLELETSDQYVFRVRQEMDSVLSTLSQYTNIEENGKILKDTLERLVKSREDIRQELESSLEGARERLQRTASTGGVPGVVQTDQDEDAKEGVATETDPPAGVKPAGSGDGPAKQIRKISTAESILSAKLGLDKPSPVTPKSPTDFFRKALSVGGSTVDVMYPRRHTGVQCDILPSVSPDQLFDIVRQGSGSNIASPKTKKASRKQRAEDSKASETPASGEEGDSELESDSGADGSMPGSFVLPTAGSEADIRKRGRVSPDVSEAKKNPVPESHSTGDLPDDLVMYKDLLVSREEARMRRRAAQPGDANRKITAGANVRGSLVEYPPPRPRIQVLTAAERYMYEKLGVTKETDAEPASPEPTGPPSEFAAALQAQSPKPPTPLLAPQVSDSSTLPPAKTHESTSSDAKSVPTTPKQSPATESTVEIKVTPTRVREIVAGDSKSSSPSRTPLSKVSSSPSRQSLPTSPALLPASMVGKAALPSSPEEQAVVLMEALHAYQQRSDMPVQTFYRVFDKQGHQEITLVDFRKTVSYLAIDPDNAVPQISRVAIQCAFDYLDRQRTGYVRIAEFKAEFAGAFSATDMRQFFAERKQRSMAVARQSIQATEAVGGVRESLDSLPAKESDEDSVDGEAAASASEASTVSEESEEEEESEPEPSHPEEPPVKEMKPVNLFEQDVHVQLFVLLSRLRASMIESRKLSPDSLVDDLRDISMGSDRVTWTMMSAAIGRFTAGNKIQPTELEPLRGAVGYSHSSGTISIAKLADLLKAIEVDSLPSPTKPTDGDGSVESSPAPQRTSETPEGAKSPAISKEELENRVQAEHDRVWHAVQESLGDRISEIEELAKLVLKKKSMEDTLRASGGDMLQLEETYTELNKAAEKIVKKMDRVEVDAVRRDVQARRDRDTKIDKMLKKQKVEAKERARKEKIERREKRKSEKAKKKGIKSSSRSRDSTTASTGKGSLASYSQQTVGPVTTNRSLSKVDIEFGSAKQPSRTSRRSKAPADSKTAAASAVSPGTGVEPWEPSRERSRPADISGRDRSPLRSTDATYVGVGREVPAGPSHTRHSEKRVVVLEQQDSDSSSVSDDDDRTAEQGDKTGASPPFIGSPASKLRRKQKRGVRSKRPEDKRKPDIRVETSSHDHAREILITSSPPSGGSGTGSATTPGSAASPSAFRQRFLRDISGEKNREKTRIDSFAKTLMNIVRQRSTGLEEATRHIQEEYRQQMQEESKMAREMDPMLGPQRIDVGTSTDDLSYTPAQPPAGTPTGDGTSSPLVAAASSRDPHSTLAAEGGSAVGASDGVGDSAAVSGFIGDDATASPAPVASDASVAKAVAESQAVSRLTAQVSVLDQTLQQVFKVLGGMGTATAPLAQQNVSVADSLNVSAVTAASDKPHPAGDVDSGAEDADDEGDTGNRRRSDLKENQSFQPTTEELERGARVRSYQECVQRLEEAIASAKTGGTLNADQLADLVKTTVGEVAPTAVGSSEIVGDDASVPSLMEQMRRAGVTISGEPFDPTRPSPIPGLDTTALAEAGGSENIRPETSARDSGIDVVGVDAGQKKHEPLTGWNGDTGAVIGGENRPGSRASRSGLSEGIVLGDGEAQARPPSGPGDGFAERDAHSLGVSQVSGKRGGRVTGPTVRTIVMARVNSTAAEGLMHGLTIRSRKHVIRMCEQLLEDKWHNELMAVDRYLFQQRRVSTLLEYSLSYISKQFGLKKIVEKHMCEFVLSVTHHKMHDSFLEFFVDLYGFEFPVGKGTSEMLSDERNSAAKEHTRLFLSRSASAHSNRPHTSASNLERSVSPPVGPRGSTGNPMRPDDRRPRTTSTGNIDGKKEVLDLPLDGRDRVCYREYNTDQCSFLLCIRMVIRVFEQVFGADMVFVTSQFSSSSDVQSEPAKRSVKMNYVWEMIGLIVPAASIAERIQIAMQLIQCCDEPTGELIRPKTVDGPDIPFLHSLSSFAIPECLLYKQLLNMYAEIQREMRNRLWNDFQEKIVDDPVLVVDTDDDDVPMDHAIRHHLYQSQRKRRSKALDDDAESDMNVQDGEGDAYVLIDDLVEICKSAFPISDVLHSISPTPKLVVPSSRAMYIRWLLPPKVADRLLAPNADSLEPLEGPVSVSFSRVWRMLKRRTIFAQRLYYQCLEFSRTHNFAIWTTMLNNIRSIRIYGTGARQPLHTEHSTRPLPVPSGAAAGEVHEHPVHTPVRPHTSAAKLETTGAEGIDDDVIQIYNSMAVHGYEQPTLSTDDFDSFMHIRRSPINPEPRSMPRPIQSEHVAAAAAAADGEFGDVVATIDEHVAPVVEDAGIGGQSLVPDHSEALAVFHSSEGSDITKVAQNVRFQPIGGAEQPTASGGVEPVKKRPVTGPAMWQVSRSNTQKHTRALHGNAETPSAAFAAIAATETGLEGIKKPYVKPPKAVPIVSHVHTTAGNEVQSMVEERKRVVTSTMEKLFQQILTHHPHFRAQLDPVDVTLLKKELRGLADTSSVEARNVGSYRRQLERVKTIVDTISRKAAAHTSTPEETPTKQSGVTVQKQLEDLGRDLEQKEQNVIGQMSLLLTQMSIRSGLTQK